MLKTLQAIFVLTLASMAVLALASPLPAAAGQFCVHHQHGDYCWPSPPPPGPTAHGPKPVIIDLPQGGKKGGLGRTHSQ